MTMHSVTTVALRVEDRVAIVELNGPGVLNALHSSTHRRLQAIFAELADRDDVGAVLLCGSGRAFCSGSDLREVGALRDAAAREYIQLDFSTKNRIAAFPKAVIAATQGYCVGGGLELILACDIRVAATDAIFSMREVRLGSLPGSGGLQRLPPVVGLGVAKEWILSGRDVGAEEAYARGLVTKLVDPDDLLGAGLEVARDLARVSPTAMHLAKVALDPVPPSDYGVVATYQMLAGEACHGDPFYDRSTSRFTRGSDGEVS